MNKNRLGEIISNYFETSNRQQFEEMLKLLITSWMGFMSSWEQMIRSITLHNLCTRTSRIDRVLVEPLQTLRTLKKESPSSISLQKPVRPLKKVLFNPL